MTDPQSLQADSTTEFEQLRPRLFGVAYRILGVVADAEDVVQETWIAWQAADRTGVAAPSAYLTKVVSNRALNRLRDTRRRREDYVGPWLPEPLDTSRRPDEAAEIADSVSYALMVMLEQLTPLERAAFVLREVFDVPTAEVAESLASTPAAVRQLVARARAHLTERDRAYDVDPSAHQRIARAFLVALAGGDLDGATALLAPDVVLVTDGGGVRRAALRPIEGPDRVLRFAVRLATKNPGYTVEVRELNGVPSAVIRRGEEVTTMHLRIVDGRVDRIFLVRNPGKLGDLGLTPNPG